MRIELIIVAFTVFFVLNAYYDNVFFDRLKSYKKYGKMATYFFIGLSMYLIIKKDPNHSKNMLAQASEFVRFMPIDRTASNMLMPILNFTGTSGANTAYPTYNSNYQQHMYQRPPQYNGQQERIMKSGKKSSKRSVSETKKKWVASNQNWSCTHCKQKLPAWFEVDHKIRLEYGGTNEVSNLEALCRDCHGRKTASENL